MRLIVPYVDQYVQPETLEFAERHHGDTFRLDDRYKYSSLFFHLWSRGEPFIICEHDIVPSDDVYDELVECPEYWCVAKYESLGTRVNSLGFSKFEPARMPKVSFYVRPVMWDIVDTMVVTTLNAQGYYYHIHDRWVRHIRPPRKGEIWNQDTDFPPEAIRAEMGKW